MNALLRDYCELISVQVDPRNHKDATYVGLEHVGSGELLRSGGGLGSDVQSSKFAFKKDDVLYGKLRPYLDKAVLADCDGICTTELLVLRAKPNVDPRFLVSVLHTSDFIEHAMSGVTGSQHPRTSWHRISEFEISVFSPEDQALISKLVWNIYSASRTNDKALATFQELKQAAMGTLFTCGLRGNIQIETEFGPVPLGWQKGVLDDCAVVQTGIAKGRRLPDSESIELPYLRVANVQDGHLDLSEMKNIRILTWERERYSLRTGDVVLTEGGDFDKLGRGFIWQGEIEHCLHQNHVFAVRPDKDIVLPEFLAYQAQSSYGKSYFLKVAHKTTNLACINSTKLKAFPVLLPKIDEQRDIVHILTSIDKKINLHKRKKLLLESFFRVVLMKLINRDIVLPAFETADLAAAQMVEALV